MKKYLEKSLIQNERVIKEAGFSKVVYILPAVVFVLFFISSLFGISSGNFGSMLAFTIVITLLALIPAFKNVMFCELAVTNKKIFGKIGFIRTEEMNSPLKQIQNVKSESGLFGKIFKFNTVTVQTTSGTYCFKFIKDGDNFKNTVMEQIENTEEDKMDTHAQKIANAIKGE